MSVLWPLQVALVERWKADPGVTALVGQRVYDGLAPSDAAFPYIRIGSKTEVEASAFAVRGSNNTLSWDVFSRPGETTEVESDAEAYAVYTAANASALGTPLAIAGYGNVGLRLDFSGSLLEDNGATRHINVRYRFSAMEAA